MASGISWIPFYTIIPNDTVFLPPGGILWLSQHEPVIYSQGANATPIITNYFNLIPGTLVGGTATWRIRWQVPVGNSGQLGIQYYTSASTTPILINESVVGTSYGHAQICGDYIFSAPNSNTTSYFVGLVNPAANDSNLTFISHSFSGRFDAVASIVFEYLTS